MAYGAYTRSTVDEAVALANLFIDRDGEVTRADLGELLRLYVLPEDELDVAQFAALAERIRHVVAVEDRESRVVRLNALLEDFQPSPRVTQHDGQEPHFHYVAADGPAVVHVGASFAMALANALVDYGSDRLGRCAAPDCERLYFDHSRSRQRRFCSKTCATRVHVAAHRARADAQD